MGPYRTSAEMPQEETKMDEKVLQLKMFRSFMAALAVAVMCIAGCEVTKTVHTNQTEILKIQLLSSPAAAAAAHERFLEAQAERDHAMFEGIIKQGGEKPPK